MMICNENSQRKESIFSLKLYDPDDVVAASKFFLTSAPSITPFPIQQGEKRDGVVWCGVVWCGVQWSPRDSVNIFFLLFSLIGVHSKLARLDGFIQTSRILKYN